MSLSALIFNTTQTIYQELPVLAVAAAQSALSSYLGSRFVSLSTPAQAAQFTATAGIAWIIYQQVTAHYTGLEQRARGSILTYVSRYTCLAGFAYGVHTLSNPEKTLASFAMLSLRNVSSLLSTGLLFSSSVFKVPNFFQ